MNSRKLSVNQALKLAVKIHKEGKLQEAGVIYRKILEKQPKNPDALHLLGVIAHQAGRYKDAVYYISKAVEIKKDAVYYGNLGMAYDALGKEEESTKSFQKALEINPHYGNAYLAHYNLGVYFKDRGEIKKALEHYDKAISLNKDFSEAHWNKGLILLLLEDFKKGWEEYEYRFKKAKPTDSRDFGKPKWDGSLLKGKRILVVSEQGFGDNIQFIRYIPLIKEKGGYVILECKRDLRRLFEDFPGVDEFVEREDKKISDINFDFYIHLMSLPKVLGTNLSNIPYKVPYLKAEPELVKKFKKKLKGRFKIGIAWAGNPNQDNDKNRSTTLENFRVLKLPGVRLFSLQKDKKNAELDSDITDMSEYIDDFADTAAIIENLDLIISVDTSIAHLAGAMCKPVWTLLCFIPDWRWLVKGEKSPWYPSMRLFRQKKPGDWVSVSEEVKKELGKLLELSNSVRDYNLD